MWKLVKYSLSMRRTQSIATAFTVAAAAAVLFCALLVYQGAQAGIARAGDQLGADLMAMPAQAASEVDEQTVLFTGAPVSFFLDDDVIADIEAIDGVTRVSGQFYGRTLDKGCCSASQPVRLIGFDPDTDWIIGSWAGLAEGEHLGAGRVVIGSNVDGFESGSGSLLSQVVQVVAVLEPTGTDLDGSIVMDIDQVRALSAAEPEFADLWREYGDPDGLVSVVMVQTEPGATDAVARKMALLPGVAVVESSTVLSGAGDRMAALLVAFGFVAALMVVACVLQLFARFYSVVWERRGELALYRSLGATRRDLRVLIVGEAALLMGTGVVAGLAVGDLLHLVVPALLANMGSFPYVAPSAAAVLLDALCVIVLLAVLGLAAVLVPLRQSARISPAAAMQIGDID